MPSDISDELATNASEVSMINLFSLFRFKRFANCIFPGLWIQGTRLHQARWGLQGEASLQKA